MKLREKFFQRERKELQRFALFNPRFIQVYGRGGRATILALALVLWLGFVHWTQPWKAGYDAEERPLLWVALVLALPGALMFASVVVEFVFKACHLVLCLGQGSLRLSSFAKVSGFGFLVSLCTGLGLLRAFPWEGEWGWFALTAALALLYLFVLLAWNGSLFPETKAQNEKGPPGATPSGSRE